MEHVLQLLKSQSGFLQVRFYFIKCRLTPETVPKE